jgi:excisionase family DNA binding protein
LLSKGEQSLILNNLRKIYMPEKQRFLTITEAAEFLQVSETSLRRWTNSGKLRCFRVGGRNERRFLKEDLLAFMQTIDLQLEAQVSESEANSDTLSVERHICLFFINQDEQWLMMRSYLLDHLSTGVPVLYIQASTPPKRLIELLREEGLPVDDLVDLGLLRIIPPEEAYLLTGRFDAQRMLAFMESAILGALAAGHDRVFLTGEMTWSLPNTPGAENMMQYEALLNPLVDRYPGVTIVCQYDLRRFDGPSVLDALLTHPSVHVSRGRLAGFYGL